MMLYVILLSVLMILLSILSMTRHLICGNNQNWLLNLNLIYETLWTGAGSGLLILILERLNWTSAIDVKIDESVLEEKSYFNMLGLTFLLSWIGALTSSFFAKNSSIKIRVLIFSMKFFSSEVALYLYKSTIHLCMEY